MKKLFNLKSVLSGANKLGLMAILAAGIFALSFKADSKQVDSKNLVNYYWYHVNPASNETFGTAAFSDTKENVIDAQDCKDAVSQPICLFGSMNPSLAAGTNVGTPAQDARILRSEN